MSSSCFPPKTKLLIGQPIRGLVFSRKPVELMSLLRSQKKLPSVGESILRSFFERSKIEVFLFTFIREEKRPSPKKDICCKKKLLTFVCVFGLCCCRFVPNMGIKAWVKYLIKFIIFLAFFDFYYCYLFCLFSSEHWNCKWGKNWILKNM